jgi:hypothetical protein
MLTCSRWFTARALAVFAHGTAEAAGARAVLWRHHGWLQLRLSPDSDHIANVAARRMCADIVAKVAERTLWNRNLKQSNRDVRAFESMLRIRARS